MDGAGDPAAWRLEIVDRIGSTNDALIRRAEAGERGRVALLAHRQDAARGSRGRTWREPASGNLALSVLLRPDGGWWSPATVVFSAALALADALSAWVRAPGTVLLKWPNDVLVGRGDDEPGKVAGILVETARGCGDAGHDWMVIGFGANLLAAPADVAGARALRDVAREDMSAEEVASALLPRLDHWIALGGAQGFAAIRAAWLERAHPVGTSLSVEARGVRRTGRFDGIDGDGALLLRTATGVERISTGTVLLGDGS